MSPCRLPGWVVALASLALALLFAACAALDPAERRREAAALAAAAGWERAALDAGDLVLVAYRPPGLAPDTHGRLTVYLEGDGLAWLTRSRASADPTPRDPLALRLALRHPGPGAAYLARPCQFTRPGEARGCLPALWTHARYGEEVVGALDRALDRLKAGAGAGSLTLVGYSGGGVLAALAAARRNDVARVVTVAANLDHAAWARHHRVAPLRGSLEPALEWRALAGIPQHHFAGAGDNIVPPEIVRAYTGRFPESRRPPLTVVEGFDHHCCWVAHWPRLYGLASEASAKRVARPPTGLGAASLGDIPQVPSGPGRIGGGTQRP